MSESGSGDYSSNLVGTNFGQYHIIDQLGKGGMATVYLAEQSSIGRQVAIKIMPPHFLHDATFLERFRREVQVIAKLQHPSILPIYDYGQHSGMPYIVMAFMSGGTLEDRIRRGPMERNLTSKILSQVAEALDHAHRNGVIHRDFKPSNVLLDRDDNAYLADFGIAKISEATVQLTGNAMVGTPAYMAPEMGSVEEVTALVDVYALGVSLYQMLSGSLPYKGETPIKVLLSHTKDPIPEIREVRGDLPGGVSEVIKKAMAKKPEERFQSAGELAEALANVVRRRVPTQQIPTISQPRDQAMEMTQPVYTPPPQPAPAPPPASQMPYTVAEQGISRPATPQPMERDHYGAGAPARPRKSASPWGLLAVVGVIVVVLVIGVVALALSGVLGGGGGCDQPSCLVLVNDSDVEICRLYVTADSSEGWGPDHLQGKRVEANGGSYTVTGIPSGTYDLRAERCDEQVALNPDVEIDELFTWTLTGGN